MEFRKLGRADSMVPALSLGTGTRLAAGAGLPGGVETREGATHFVDLYLDAWLTLFDSADLYSGGATQEKTVAQIAINWVVQRPSVSAVIIGARDEPRPHHREHGRPQVAPRKPRRNRMGANTRANRPPRRRSAKQRIYPYWHQA